MIAVTKRRDMREALATLLPTFATVMRPSGPSFWTMVSSFRIRTIGLHHCEPDILGAGY